MLGLFTLGLFRGAMVVSGGDVILGFTFSYDWMGDIRGTPSSPAIGTIKYRCCSEVSRQRQLQASSLMVVNN